MNYKTSPYFKFLLLFTLVFSSGIKLNAGVSLSLFDLLFILICFTALLANKTELRLTNGIKLIIPILIVQFIPFIFQKFHIYQILYSVRLAQYAIIGVFLHNFIKNHISEKLLNWFLIISISLFTCFYIFKGQYHPFSYRWEASALISLTLAYILIRTKNAKPPFVVSILILILFITNQRSPLIAGIVSLIFHFFKNKKLNSLLIPSIILIPLLILYLTEIKESRFYQSLDTVTYENIKSSFKIISEEAGYYEDYNEYVYGDRNLRTSGGDLSFELRLKKWLFAISKIDFLGLLFGLGPGYFGGAADSSFIRAFIETGIIGLFLWFRLLKYLYHKTPFVLFINIMINAIFIDTFYSSKIVLFTFFLIILYENRSKFSNL